MSREMAASLACFSPVESLASVLVVWSFLRWMALATVPFQDPGKSDHA